MPDVSILSAYEHSLFDICCRHVAINMLLVADGIPMITSCRQFAVNTLLITDGKLTTRVVVKLLSQITFLRVANWCWHVAINLPLLELEFTWVQFDRHNADAPCSKFVKISCFNDCWRFDSKLAAFGYLGYCNILWCLLGSTPMY